MRPRTFARMQRRQFLQTAGGLAAGAMGMLSTHADELPKNANPRAVFGDTVEPDWEQRVAITVGPEKADLVGFSALLSTTIYYQKVTIEEFAKAGLRNKVKILVGGAPTSQQWADEIGADGWGKDAMFAVQLAKRLVKEPRETWE